MTLKLECREYGFECDFVLEGPKSIPTLEKLREHFESEHGIDYSKDAVIQMVVHKGHSRDSIKNE